MKFMASSKTKAQGPAMRLRRLRGILYSALALLLLFLLHARNPSRSDPGAPATHGAAEYQQITINSSGPVLDRMACVGGVVSGGALPSGGSIRAYSPAGFDRTAPYKLINFFSVNNELDMLEIHLQEYWDIVDTYVVMESPLTFSNQRKPLHFAPTICTPRFAPYLPKLVHVLLDPSLRGANDDAWAWEAAHRVECCRRDAMHAVGRLLDLQPTDLLLSHDVDELPYASAVAEGANVVWNALAADNGTLPVVEWGLTMYYFSLFHKVPQPWEHYAKIYPFGVGQLASFSAMRVRHDQCEGCQYPHERIKTVKSVPLAGIHPTYFFRFEHLMQKLRAFSHFDHWEWGGGQSDEELIERARANLRVNKGWFGVEMESIEPVQNPELLPFKPAVRVALITQSLALQEAQLGAPHKRN